MPVKLEGNYWREIKIDIEDPEGNTIANITVKKRYANKGTVDVILGNMNVADIKDEEDGIVEYRLQMEDSYTDAITEI